MVTIQVDDKDPTLLGVYFPGGLGRINGQY